MSRRHFRRGRGVPAGRVAWQLIAACVALIVGAAVTSTAAAVGATEADDTIKGCVVKVFATVRRPDLAKPWGKQSPVDVVGSGAVIAGHRILTNAHVVQYASQVQIQANQAGDKIEAKVLVLAPAIDLAILSVDDADFFKEHPAIELAAGLPKIKDTVLAYGFPTGGTSLSVTKGIVSRIEFVDYSLHASGLRVQIDAALNPGNSGGPVAVGDRMIGLAFATQGNNIGYVIPNQEIALFLQDAADGRYDGEPAMRDTLQSLENRDLRRFLKLDKSVHGVVVHRPFRTEAAYPLKEWDVISAIGAVPIDDQGMISQLGEAPTDGREELVVVPSPFLPHRLTAGYENPSGAIVSRVNGTRITSLRQLVTVLRDLKDEFVRFDMEPADRQSVVFDRQALEAATEEILNDNGIRALASPDLLQLWQQRSSGPPAGRWPLTRDRAPCGY